MALARRPDRPLWRQWIVLVTLMCCFCVSVFHSEEECADCKYPCTKVCERPTMHALACDLDHLEKHIEKFGSVVAKVPDVWGQARLTKYREEFEKEMAPDISRFQETLQGRLQRDDQAFFANAFALSAAISGPGAVTTFPSGTLAAGQSTTAVTQRELQPVIPPGATTGVGSANTPATLDAGNLINPNFFESVTTTSAAFTRSMAGADSQPLKISLEPTEVLAQKERYINLLNQLRRNNEGDDTADSPGYSLNLIRIPVSILPGMWTKSGHGAEITFTLDPLLGDELLPMTFRNLVVNDVVDQVATPLTILMNEKDEKDRSIAKLLLTCVNHKLLNLGQLDETNEYICVDPEPSKSSTGNATTVKRKG